MLWAHLLLGIAATAIGAVHEKLERLPRGWSPTSEVLGEDAIIELHVALQYENIETLDARLHSVSDPSSSAYGSYLDLHDLHAIFDPSLDRKNRVTSWLESNTDVQISTHDQNTVSFVSTVAAANQLLNASFALYTNGDITKLGTLTYSVPDELSGDVDIITPTTYFGYPRKPRKPRSPDLNTHQRVLIEKRSSLPGCHDVRNVTFGGFTLPFPFVTSKCYPTLYNIGDYVPEAKSGSNIAFSSFLDQVANYDDLKMFTSQYKIPDRNFSILALINGAKNDQTTAASNRDEANLDSQTIISLVGNLPVGEYIERGKGTFIPNLEYKRNDDEPFLQFYQYLLSQPNDELPWVISNSYADDEVNVPKKYAVRACNMIAMLGLRGRTIIAPAGDSGPGDVCLSASGKKQFIPMFPPDCPYVTSVGGTQGSDPVQASVNGGGGFSTNFFATPAYQKDAVSTYLSKYISSETKNYYASNGYVNFSGRGIPDISANFGSPQFPVIINGTLLPGGGTSEAAPIVASIIALLNDARFKAGKPAMGFINPWLYKVAAGKAITDVTKGSATGCPSPEPNPKGTPKIPYASWNATIGWDPVTGLGYPNFMELLKLAV